jgi:hypothetical protein
MNEEQTLQNGTHPIIRIGNEVHRPANFWTPAVHHLLKYLETINFPYAPRVLGFDDAGREVLTHFEGESGKAGWGKIVTDEGLVKFAKLLRAYHDAVSNYVPPTSLEWATGATKLKPGEIICHGDFGPWNIVWQQDDPVGLIDWDLVHPAPREHDILYALEYCVPFRDDETSIKWHHFPTIPDRRHRAGVFFAAYGTAPLKDLPIKVAEVQRMVGQFEAYLAKRGIQPQADWVADGDLNEVEKRARWTESNGKLF